MKTIFILCARTLRSLMSYSALMKAGLCCLVSAVILMLWIGGFNVLVNHLNFFGGWIDKALDVFLGIGSLILAWALFPVLLPMIASLFLDGYLERLSLEEYRTPLRSVPIREELPKNLLFLIQGIGVNLLLIPFYFMPPIGHILYYVANGYLLARAFWTMICARMMLEERSLHARRSILMISGILFVACANIPLLNLLAPLIAATYMLHLGHYSLERREVMPKDGQTILRS